MLRGYQRNLVMIRTRNSEIFESAFFILRKSSSTTHADMVSEANRILSRCGAVPKKPRKERLRHIFITAGIGFLIGAAAVGIAWAVSAL